MIASNSTTESLTVTRYVVSEFSGVLNIECQLKNLTNTDTPSATKAIRMVTTFTESY